MVLSSGHEAVRRVVKQELSDLAELWEGVVSEEHNVFLVATAPTLAVASKLTRRLTSRMGRKLARMARQVAEIRFGAELLPVHLPSPHLRGVHREVPHVSDDTFVYTDFDETLTTALTLDLIDKAGRGAKIGTDEFRAEYVAAIDELVRRDRAPEPWAVQVDLAVLEPTIGFAELESGGMLDSSNAIGQSRKLVRAGLAYGDRSMSLHFCTAYANDGEGRPIKGSLRKYFVQEPDHHDGLLVGSSWWKRILPADVTFDDFLEIFHEVAVEYEIAGPSGD